MMNLFMYTGEYMLGMANALKQTANQHKTTLLMLFLLVLMDCFFLLLTSQD